MTAIELTELAARVEAGDEEDRKMCVTCQGNGEIVTDWDRYLHGGTGDEAIADCLACDGVGTSRSWLHTTRPQM